jgi:NADH-quinone oxidoreductase subunit L
MSTPSIFGLLPLFPFIGFLILVLVGNFLSKSMIALTGVGSIGISAILTAWIGADYLAGNMLPLRVLIGSWLVVDQLSVPYGFYLDALSLTMLFVVTGVGFLIHIYSAEFMEGDADNARFFAYMNLFVSAMLVLVLADNLVLLFLGWEGVGLGSYLLIGFWYQDPANGAAASKAFIMTRVGDTSFTIGLFLIFAQLHTLDVQSLMVNAKTQWQPGTALPILTAALLLGGAVGKSAQLPLQTWLPDAMAGPTPVSALIHAATMVTAGVYLIARMHVLFELAPTVQFVVAVIGAATLLLAGCTALVQTDIKRILAYSTMSQIGYMFLALGVGAWSAAIFHLMSHAFFKALLFLAAGAVIYSLQHETNIFNMGGLRKSMPVAFVSFLIGIAALTGLPFTSGYYSKHEILTDTYAVSPFLWAVGCLGALVTGIYSFRLVLVAFFGPQKATANKTIGLKMGVPLLLLCFLVLIGGPFRIPLDSVFPISIDESDQRPLGLINLITLAAPFTGLLIAMLLYFMNTCSPERPSGIIRIRHLQEFLFGGWGFDWLYGIFLVSPFKYLAIRNKSDFVDEAYSAVTMLSSSLHRYASLSQTGKIRWYATSMGLGAVVIIAIGLLS